LKNGHNLYVMALSMIAFALLLSPSVSGMTGTSAPETKNITIGLTAKDIAFNTSTITVPAGSNVTIVFDNQDASVAHNFALYETPDAVKSIFVGDTILGPKVIDYSFTAPDKPGMYFFRCDVHPLAMKGDFIVK
jgi:plastocyanin